MAGEPLNLIHYVRMKSEKTSAKLQKTVKSFENKHNAISTL